MSSSNCCLLTCKQVSQEAGKVDWYSHLLKKFPHFVVIHTVKGLSVANEAEADVFLTFPYFLYDPTFIGILISVSSAFSKSGWNIWKFSVHVLLKPGLENFMHYFANMWKECNCVVVWTFFDISLLWDWNENWSFPVLGHWWVFQICWHIECSTLPESSYRFEIAQLESHHFH